MSTRRFQDIWVEQCRAAGEIRERHGLEAAFDYLVSEKLMTYAETAAKRAEFARELPRFVAEVRRIFSADEIAAQLARMERGAPDDADADAIALIDVEFQKSAAEQEQDDARYVMLRELLTARHLGIS